MIASLMMYARPELDAAHENLWKAIRKQLAAKQIESPECLSQQADAFSVWLNPEMVLSQTCGMPYRMRLHGKVNLVGTPDYGIKGCPPGYYRSPLVVNIENAKTDIAEFKDAILAYNQTDSQSGFAAIYSHVKPLGFWFKHTLETGGHLESARAVAEGRADIASLDAMTWRLICRYEEFSSHLKVLEWTEPTPGLPLITSLKHDPDILYSAVSNAIAELEGVDRELLELRGLVKIPEQDYLAIANPNLS